ncbi:hypothetical protein D3C80_1274940 [compost metagenome]
MKSKKLVEVTVPHGSDHVPLGIMNAQQALDLPADIEVRVTHPDRTGAAADLFMDRSELRAHLRASGEL